MDTTISIALATYNGEAFLLEQLNSIAQQTRLPDELIVADDASADRTVEVVQDFARRSPFHIRLLPSAGHFGVAANFNRALTEARGDLVFLCDQDDVWLPNKLQLILEHSQSHPHAMVLMNDVDIVGPSLEPAGFTKLQQFHTAGFSVDGYTMGAAAAIRKEFLDAVLPIPSGYPAHDDWIVQFAVWLGRRHLIPCVLQQYRIHGSNTSTFFVNSTKRAPRMFATRERLSRVFAGGPLEVSREQLSFMALQHQGAKRASGQAPGILALEFADLATKLSRKMTVTQERLSILSMPRGKRLPKIQQLMLDGGYDSYRGYASAVADLIVPKIPSDALPG